MKKILFVFMLAVAVSCTNHHEQNLLSNSSPLCGVVPHNCRCDLYWETYHDKFLGFRTGLQRFYLTDSSTFRVFVHRYNDEKEMMMMTCENDYVIFELRTHEGYPDWQNYQVRWTRRYLVDSLKRRGSFE